MAEVVDIYPPEICDDLKKSGIEPGLMRVRQMGPNEIYATGAPANSRGYVIPYFNHLGKPIPFYRVRLFDSEVRYRQVANQPNHLYFPPGFAALVAKANCPYILFTEGEKKAASAVQQGIAACSVGGVDSWRNRIISIPKGASIAQGTKGATTAKLASGTEVLERLDSLAVGMQDLIALILHKDIPILITYDTDHLGRTNHEVQAAAASLGFELRFRGIPTRHIRQLYLKPHPGFELEHEKCGVDDFLSHPKLGRPIFDQQVKEVLNAKQAFPRHPNPKAYVNKRLQRTRMPRSDIQALSTAILCDLDCRGSRLRCPNDGRLYYFQRATHQLIPVHFNMQRGFANSPFGVYTYRTYNLGGSDHRLMEWLETQFTGEDPITDVEPERVLTVRKDTIYYQISQGRTLKINADGITFADNGSDDILFESSIVEDLDEGKLQKELKKLQEEHPASLPNYWYTTLKEARIPETEDDNARRTLALLYSISPWFYRWRGTQLPIEMMIAEPGSGKSTLFELRLDILTGQPKLRNAPRDMRDWTASVATAGGLHVTDNVNLSNSQLRQELSDEICRIITEPNPSIEARKLYTDNELIQTPVKTVFAITAVRQPFNNPDILQRSIITYLDKGDGEVHYEADWERRQLARFGGREGWIAYHAVLIHRLLKLVRDKWDPRYRAAFRLINVEQLLKFTAELYGWDTDWISSYLEAVRDRSVASADWVLEGLSSFLEEGAFYPEGRPHNVFGAAEVADWARGHEDYAKNNILTSSRQVANYLKQHKHMVSRIVGVSEAPQKVGNKVVYWYHGATVKQLA